MEARLNEVNELSNQSRAQLGDSADVLRGLEAKLRHTEVNRQILPHFFKPIMKISKDARIRNAFGISRDLSKPHHTFPTF